MKHGALARFNSPACSLDRPGVNQTGAALLEFAIVAVLMLGILLPGMISVGKSLSELNVAAQSAFLGVQSGAQVKVGLGAEPVGGDPGAIAAWDTELNTLKGQVTTEVRARVDAMYPIMSTSLEAKTVNQFGPDAISLFRLASEDPDHWMVQTDITAYFPAILTSIPVRVKSVGSMLNVQPRTAGDLSAPRRVRGPLDQPYTFTCAPVSCGTRTDANCVPDCCRGFLPGGSSSSWGILSNDEGWRCTGAEFGPGGGGTGGPDGGGGGPDD